ncbi:MAG: type II toxin-antitoxin system HipA family toxin [Alphaproteobacteria bacterium]|nr:type II toxin-antitoxin system HipA family toxin [Alphaproteobacteria bacterium]
MADISVLDVRLHDKRIGTLTRLNDDRIIFGFEQAYIDDEARDTLSLSFKGEFGGLLTATRPTQTRLMPFFANLLPEGPLRDLLAARAGIKTTREFFLLWALGQDLPGALVIQPTDGEAMPAIADDGADNRRNTEHRPLRFSLAGVQLKFSALMRATGGLTIPANGIGGSWIVKLPSAKFNGVPENEFAMMTLARYIGIDVPETKLVPIDEIEGLPDGVRNLGSMAFAIKRFDRLDDGRAIHIEDFAQVFGAYPEEKYESASYKNIAEVLWMEIGEAGIEEFIRRLVFSALIGNGDMHLKNWSLIYPDRRNAALAPAYDFVSTITYLPDDKMALNFARTKKFTKFSKDELTYLAAKARLPHKLVLGTALETVARFQDVWRRERASLGLASSALAAIDRNIERVPIAAGR